MVNTRKLLLKLLLKILKMWSGSKMGKTVADVEDQINELLDLGEPLSYQEVCELHRLSVKLGEYNVHNQNGWEYDFE